MLSCKAIYLRRSTALSLLDLRILLIQIMCVGLIALYMVLSRLLVLGSVGLLRIFCSLDLLRQSQTPRFLFIIMEQMWHISCFMSMTLS